MALLFIISFSIKLSNWRYKYLSRIYQSSWSPTIVLLPSIDISNWYYNGGILPQVLHFFPLVKTHALPVISILPMAFFTPTALFAQFFIDSVHWTGNTIAIVLTETMWRSIIHSSIAFIPLLQTFNYCIHYVIAFIPALHQCWVHSTPCKTSNSNAA